MRDWFLAQEEGYEPIYLRAQQTPIDWKSKVGSSDMNVNFKVTHDIPIHKGDIVIREDGVQFMFIWNVQNHANNQATQTAELNTHIEVYRNMPAVVDEDGYEVEPERKEIIVPGLPCMHTEYAGRPDFSAAQGQPGINGDHLLEVSMQWNSRTKNIRIGDEFVLGAYTYRVVNVTIKEVSIWQEYGVLIFNARRIAGGGIVE